MADAINNLSDADLVRLGQTISTALAAAAPETYGSTAAKVTALDALFNTFKDGVGEQKAKLAEAQSLTASKNEFRAGYVTGLREFLGVAKASGTPRSDLELLGVPANGGVPLATVPQAKVDTSKRMTHKISWGDVEDVGHKRRPKGVMGVEIWVKIGDPAPGNEKDCVFLAVAPSSPYLASYEPADAGKIAHYMLRWRLLDGSTNTWGETVSATITG